MPGQNWPAVINAAQDPEGNILACGIEMKSVVDNGVALPERRFTVSITPNGEVRWEKDRPYGDAAYVIRCLTATDDGFFALIMAENNFDSQLAKLDSEGELVAIYPMYASSAEGTWPNAYALYPAKDHFLLIEREIFDSELVYITQVSPKVGVPVK